MPNFNSILARVILGESRQTEAGVDYLCAGFKRYLTEPPQSYQARDDDDDDNSITSFSTTATADNLPGTGRTVDTYIFQPVGRRIERLAMRFTIASLHPARIAQYIETDETEYFPYSFNWYTLNEVVADLCGYRQNGSTILAGMKGLVKQTQCVLVAMFFLEERILIIQFRSSSIHKAASALAALIRVALSHRRRESMSTFRIRSPYSNLKRSPDLLLARFPRRCGIFSW